MAKDHAGKKDKTLKKLSKTERPSQTVPADAPTMASKHAVDPALASLFASSLGPIKPLPKSSYAAVPRKTAQAKDSDEEDGDTADESDDEELSELSSLEDAEDSAEESESEGVNGVSLAPAPEESAPAPRKRKRQDDDANLEQRYLTKLAKEEEKEAESRREERQKKRAKKEDTSASSDEEADSDAAADASSDDESDDAPNFTNLQHETLATNTSQTDVELEKASRTVFLGNVSTLAITSKSSKKVLMTHLSSHLSALPPSTPPHKLLSLRFRSTPFSSPLPKKAAFATGDLMAATTPSTNAYAVYSTPKAALTAPKALNGSLILARHLRVDHVAHPAPIDHRRCIFVGNLAFVSDPSSLPPPSDTTTTSAPPPRKSNKPPADPEEGLWTHLASCGPIDSVRVIRDPQTRVGKGFAYVQFHDPNGVEAALLLDGKSFPPLLPRKLRVVRARAMKRNSGAGGGGGGGGGGGEGREGGRNPSARSAAERGGRGIVGRNAATGPSANKSTSIYNPKRTAAEKTAQGRAARMLGKAGAAQFQRPEAFVFEGHRATASQGKSGFKFKGGKGKKVVGAGKKGKPSSRSREWKRNGAMKRD